MKTWADAINKIGYNTQQREEVLDALIYKKIDHYPYDNKQYKLKCVYPCNDCKDDEPTYCLRCWGNTVGGVANANSFLQQTDTTSTCQHQCKEGFTVDGNIVSFEMYDELPKVVNLAQSYKRCVKCDESCTECVGRDNKNKDGTKISQPDDRFLCTKCGGALEYIYEKDYKC